MCGSGGMRCKGTMRLHALEEPYQAASSAIERQHAERMQPRCAACRLQKVEIMSQQPGAPEAIISSKRS